MNNSSDRRVRRTYTALISAFNELVVSRPYSRIRVEDIIERADVGRSTFYEHFTGKDGLLVQSMDFMLQVLADCVQPRPHSRIHEILGHFVENRQLAQSVLRGSARRCVEERLRCLLLQRLERVPGLTITGARLHARAVASAQLSLLLAWLSGDESGTVDEVAQEMCALARLRV